MNKTERVSRVRREAYLARLPVTVPGIHRKRRHRFFVDIGRVTADRSITTFHVHRVFRVVNSKITIKLEIGILQRLYYIL